MTGDANTAWEWFTERRFHPGEPLGPLTTIRTGGPAKWLLDVGNEEELALALRAARGVNVPVLVMGRGSNLLVADAGFDGLVIRFGPGYSQVRVAGERVYAQAGASLKKVACFAADHGLAGLAFAAGIPGSLGGGCLMNAGAYNGVMADVVERVDCLTPEGDKVSLSGEEAEFAYRHSRMMDEGLIVLGAEMRLLPGSRDALYATMAQLQAMRREKQPLTWPSAGSFFRRPPGYYAGALIEQAELKGLTVGRAQVSELHAGFLINLGGATTADFIALKDEVIRRVQERWGVTLTPEVRIVGTDGA